MGKFWTIIKLTTIVCSHAYGDEVGNQDANSKIVGLWKSVEDVNAEPQVVVTITETGKQLSGKFIFLTDSDWGSGV